MKPLKSLFLIMVCLFALFPVCRAENYALLIGIDEYKDHDSINSLSGAGADAKALAKTLVEVAGFKQDNIHLLTSDGETKPDKSNIIFEIEQLKKRVKSGDLVFVFYSGHGIEMDGVSYLVPWDTDVRTDANLTDSALPTSKIAAALGKLPAKALILAFDMCRSDPRKGHKDVTPNNTLGEKQARSLVVKAVDDGSGPEATITLFSCKPRERSWEWTEKGRGYFSYFLEQGLRKEAADSQGVVRVHNLVSYLEKGVYGAVQRDRGEDQNPYSLIDGTGANDLVLADGRPPGNGGETAVKKNGDNTEQSLYEAALQKGYELGRQNDWDGALHNLSDALALNPKSARAAYAIGYIYEMVKKDYEAAEKMYRKTIELDPKDANPVNGLGNIYYNRGDYDEAKTFYQKAIKINPKNVVPVMNLARLHLDIKHDSAEAKKLLLKAMKLEPKFVQAVYALAVIYGNEKDFKQAEKLFRQATELAPENGLFHAQLALCLLAIDRRDEAVTEAKESLALGFREPHPVFRALGLNP